MKKVDVIDRKQANMEIERRCEREGWVLMVGGDR